jgi:hypothetical protein
MAPSSSGSTFLPSTENRISGTTTLTTAYTYDNSGRVTLVDGPVPGTGDTRQPECTAIWRVPMEAGRWLIPRGRMAVGGMRSL